MDKRRVAQIGAFSSIYAISRVVPLFPILGGGVAFPLSDILVPLYGILFVPQTAALSILLGTFISFALGRPVIFLGLDFLPGLLAAFSLSYLIRGRKSYFLGFMIGSIVLFNMNRFVTPLIDTPIGPVPFQYIHIIVLILILLVPLRKVERAYVIYVPFLAFSGTILQHAVGSTMFVYIFGDLLHKIPAEAWPAIWTGSFYLYPIERGFMALASSLLAIPLLYLIRRSPELKALVS